MTDIKNTSEHVAPLCPYCGRYTAHPCKDNHPDCEIAGNDPTVLHSMEVFLQDYEEEFSATREEAMSELVRLVGLEVGHSAPTK